MAKKKRKKTVGDYIRDIILVIAIGVFLFSAYQLFQIFMEYKKGDDEYDRIREYVKEETVDTEADEEAEELLEGRPLPKAPAVDFAALLDINPDVIGWIQVNALDISYPVVKGEDNNHYLHYTFEGQQNAAGTIFIDAANDGEFKDLNTIIYGHNMKNGSMFGTLRKLPEKLKEKEEDGKFIWVCTPDKKYLYQIFSFHTTDAAGDTYTLFTEATDEYEAYLNKMLNASQMDMETEIEKEDRIITLSTCTGNDATRFVVQAKLVGIY